jgi:hypothetical protein
MSHSKKWDRPQTNELLGALHQYVEEEKVCSALGAESRSLFLLN